MQRTLARRADPGAGIASLAALVNEALCRLGTRPVFTGAGLSSPVFMSVEVGASRPSSGGLTQRRAPVSDRPRSPGTTRRPRPDTQPDTIEPEHSESWHLVQRAQDGDGEAFGQLYDRYIDLVYRFIYFRVNDQTLAEDFTSETFLRGLRRIGTISYQGRDIGAWFITIARNIVFDHMKSARHRLEVSTSETREDPDLAPGPESAALTVLERERLMGAVRMLGDDQRECVFLRFIQGFSVSETASVMGKNDGAIKALQHRAIRKLAELIGDDLR